VEQDLTHAWGILEGEGALEPIDEVAVTQGEVVCRAEAQITVTASLVSRTGSGDSTYQGLPGYVGIPQDQLLERLLELTLYTEENLR
jgi:hypothetical protein